MALSSTPQAGNTRALARGSTLPPHMRVITLDGSPFDYAGTWQRRNLLLVALPPAGARDSDEAAWLAALDTSRQALETYDAAVVVTRDAVPGLDAPGVLVADRWGEVAFVQTARRIADLPPPAALDDWLKFVDHACPECEGEAR